MLNVTILQTTVTLFAEIRVSDENPSIQISYSIICDGLKVAGFCDCGLIELWAFI